MYTGFLLLIFAAATAAALWLLSRGVYRRRSVQLIDASIEIDDFLHAPAEKPTLRWLIRWLHLAGYRAKPAPLSFLLALTVSVAVAAATAVVIRQSGLVELMSESLRYIPGGIGDLAAIIVSFTNWVIFACLAAVPALVVRAKRRRRVEQIEQDLPLFLELLATLVEAGLGFEAGLARLAESETANRPLNAEFRLYQRDLLAGVSRVQALRYLARRVEVNSITVFVSALIQAERVGASLAGTLRRQSDDLRDRRKMRALLQSQALTVKLVFPLVLCFLPGIFVSTLGPVINQMIKVMDSVLRTVR
jgi:tight adherence protein C